MIATLTTARGGTGVTTTAVALALAWPRPVVLVEADASGYCPVMAGFLRAAVPAGPGIVEAAIAARNGELAAQLPGMLVALPGSTARLLPGMTSTAQRRAMTPAAWLDLASDLAEHAQDDGFDLIIDTGTLSTAGHPSALHAVADSVLLCTRTDLPSVSAARNWVDDLASPLPDPAAVSLAVIGSDAPYSAAEVANYLGLTRTAQIGWEPVEAAAYTFGQRLTRRPRGALTRSLAGAVRAIMDSPRLVDANV